MIVEKMNYYFSPVIAAYRENYSTQHVTIRLSEEWRLQLNDNCFVGAIMTVFQRLATAYRTAY